MVAKMGIFRKSNKEESNDDLGINALLNKALNLEKEVKEEEVKQLVAEAEKALKRWRSILKSGKKNFDLWTEIVDTLVSAHCVLGTVEKKEVLKNLMKNDKLSPYFDGILQAFDSKVNDGDVVEVGDMPDIKSEIESILPPQTANEAKLEFEIIISRIKRLQ
jgi:Zn-dependent M32 family carboxypeptidase